MERALFLVHQAAVPKASSQPRLSWDLFAFRLCFSVFTQSEMSRDADDTPFVIQSVSSKNASEQTALKTRNGS